MHTNRKRQMTADIIANKINGQLKISDVQLCNHACRFIVKKGSAMVARGNSLYINGKGAAFLVGSFKAYAH
jgi:ABC-type uncharacterized transport system fused permease/ATPase subunit